MAFSETVTIDSLVAARNFFLGASGVATSHLDGFRCVLCGVFANFAVKIFNRKGR
jgi:hypothetical protein